MFKRTLKRFVGGKWEPVKWHRVKVDDIIRVYERGMLAGEMDATVQAPCDIVEIDGLWYEELLTDKGRINSKGLMKPQANLRNPHKRKHRQRQRDVLK